MERPRWDVYYALLFECFVLICFCLVVVVVYLLCVYFSGEVARVKGGYGRTGKCMGLGG